MKKEDLTKLGLDEATATKIAAARAEELKRFIPKVRFDEVNESKKELEEQVKARDKQLEGLKKSVGNAEALKTEIATLQGTIKTIKEDYEGKIKKMQIDNAVNAALTGANAKNLKAVRALLDLDKAELNGENIKGLDTQIKALQADEGTKFLFDASTPTTFQGVKPGERIDKTSQHDGAAIVTQSIKLFIAPEINVKPNSKITVTQNSITNDDQSSNKPAMYSIQQEISVELCKAFA